jgi:hypothetical protein
MSRCSSSSSTRRPPTGPAGVSRPSATPAIVAWMPDSSVATHTAIPTGTYGQIRDTPARRIAYVSASSATAATSQPAAMSSV